MIFIKPTNFFCVSVSALAKLCANAFVHNQRTTYMLLNLTANLDTEVL